jgi:GrpB-like predicted nucleotidyltransferase (UPF0157 family)
MMSQQESLQLAINEGIEIVPYNSDWPSKFEREHQRLLTLFPDDFLGVEHFGSTSIPRCYAKSIVDILASVPSLAAVDSTLTKLCQNGYDTSAEFNATLKTSRWAMSHVNGKRIHHIHLVLHESADWRNKILFRDILRRDPLLVDQYIELKLELAKKSARDRERYTALKSDFIAMVLRGGIRA